MMQITSRYGFPLYTFAIFNNEGEKQGERGGARALYFLFHQTETWF